jgi:hypothetical protein
VLDVINRRESPDIEHPDDHGHLCHAAERRKERPRSGFLPRLLAITPPITGASPRRSLSGASAVLDSCPAAQHYAEPDHSERE